METLQTFSDTVSSENGPQGQVRASIYKSLAPKMFVRYRRKNYRTDRNENFHVESPSTKGCTAEVS